MLDREQSEFGSFVWEPEPEERWVGNEDDEEDWEEDEEDEPEQEKDRARNPDGYWGTDRVRRVMQQESRERMGAKMGTSIWRHVYPAIQREFTGDKEVAQMLDRIYDGQEGVEDPEESARAEQSGHSRYIEEQLYGKRLGESPFQTISERRNMRKVSIDWHRFLHFPSAWEAGSIDPNSRRQIEAQQQEEEYHRWKQMRQIDILSQFRRLVGPQAQFRGLQQDGLDAIIRRQRRILIVMRTGGGKSLFFMIPAMGAPGGVTIVIVPIISLRADLKSRCDRAGIACAEWNGERPAHWASIILVTPEAAVQPRFQDFMAEKRMMRQLDRIIVDECHVVLESTKTWRPEMFQVIRDVGAMETQVIYLTATLPPRLAAQFHERIGVRASEMRILRESTTRRNVRYQVHDYAPEEQEQVIRDLVEEKKAQYPLPGQMIVYCRTVGQTKQYSKVLGCPAFYREVGTGEVKEAILQDLVQGREQVFTATNALGLGVDAPQIRTVIHVGIRESMRQYAQESGRAGRDGGASEAIILRKCWVKPDGRRTFEQGWRTEKGMKGFLAGTQCRRIAIDEEMDGRTDRSGCETDEERCDVCMEEPKRGYIEDSDSDRSDSRRKRVRMSRESEDDRTVERVGSDREGSEAGDETISREETMFRDEFRREQQQHEIHRRREIERRMAEGLYVRDLRQRFEAWSGVCVICKAYGIDEREHRWPDCTRYPSYPAEMKAGIAWIEEIRFEKFGCCFDCWAPQEICQAWEAIQPGRYRPRKEIACQFPDVIKEAFVAIHQAKHDQIEPWIAAECDKEGLETEDIRPWLAKRRDVGGMTHSVLCYVFSIWG